MTRLSLRVRWSSWLRTAMEVVVLAMIVVSPWLFGAVEPFFEWLLMTAVALVAGLWAARMMLDQRLSLAKCPALFGLASIFVLGLWQLLPLPARVLAWAAPGSQRLCQSLLPESPEVLPFGESRSAVTPAPGSTISLYPGATRQELTRLLAVVLLFAAVRSNLSSSRTPRRLSIVCVINGAALALLGLTQFFSSPHHILYWTFPSQGQVFGPFICRNHFPFYINLCIGLGLGLLLDRKGDRPDASAPPGSWLANTFALLHQPGALWICLSLALMGCAVLLTLSRGGLAALLLGCLVVVAIRSRFAQRSKTVATLIVPAAVGLGLAAWMGMGIVETRLGTLWHGSALLESRLPLWMRGWTLVREFLPLGSGYGTYAVVEPLNRDGSVNAEVLFEHAHNDFLETLIEGGPIRLALCLFVIGWVFRQGIRAIRVGSSTGLALGALAAFTTLIVHSFGDFGLHIPAIAVLATVLAAHLCNCGDRASSRATSRQRRVREDRFQWRGFGLAPLAGGLAVVAVGGLLFVHSWRAERVHRLRIAAFHSNSAPDVASLQRRVDLLEAAAALAPQYARLQFEVGQVHAALFDHLTKEAERDQARRMAARVVFAAGLVGPRAEFALTAYPAMQLADAGRFRDQKAESIRVNLVPALRHWLRARDLCPLMSQPHLRLAAYRNQLAQAEPRSAYLDRGKRLLAFDAEFWYFCGVQELLDGDVNASCGSWRRCLELSENYMPRILELSHGRIEPTDIIERTLPDRPDRLLAAAEHLFPDPDADERRLLLIKAISLLDVSARVLSAEDRHLRAVIQRDLKNDKAAEEDFRAALGLKPRQISWRMELAKHLHHIQRLPQAREELLIVLSQQPNLTEARQLLDQVERVATRRP